MASTRSTRSKGASPLDGDVRRSRMLKELHIDGTNTLRTGEKAQHVGTVRKDRGGTYVVEDDGFSWARTSLKRTAGNTAPSPPPPAKRPRREAKSSSISHVAPISAPRGNLKRPADDTAPPPPPPAKRPRREAKSSDDNHSAPVSAAPSKKRKRDDVSAPRDADFLTKTIDQLRKVKVPRTSSRQAELRMMLPYLEALKPVRSQRIERKAPQDGQARQEAPDMYELDGMEAKRFFLSGEKIGAPVFVAGGISPFLDPESDARPIEQVVDWLPNHEESYETDDLELTLEQSRIPRKLVKIGDIRQRFVDDQRQQRFPWNFPEIPFPTAAESMPAFLRHPSCNLLRDVVRFVQDLDVEDICQKDCPNHAKTADGCDRHVLTVEENFELHRGFRHWLGTIMMAEAGALTQAHFDALGFGTFISCYESEIGFAWLGNATAGDGISRQDGVKPSDRWLFRILRPGNAVYMPPGTWHLVFRQPEGGQTLASAFHALRYCDIVDWLSVVSVELQQDLDKGASLDDHLLVKRCLTLGVRHLIDQAMKQGNEMKFGGKQKVTAAEKLLEKIDAQLKQFG